MRPLDLKALMEASEKVVTLPHGEVRVRRVSRTEYQTLMPTRPEHYPEWEQAIDQELAGIEGLSKEDRETRRATLLVQRESAWLESLSPGERVSRREELLEGLYRVIARSLLSPAMTVDHVKRLGDEAFVILDSIRAFWVADDQAAKNGIDQPAQVVTAA
jgi:hypothetical protein